MFSIGYLTYTHTNTHTYTHTGGVAHAADSLDGRIEEDVKNSQKYSIY
jgi:hypothetical protein